MKEILTYNFDDYYFTGSGIIRVIEPGFNYEVDLSDDDLHLSQTDLLNKYRPLALQMAAYQTVCNEAEFMFN